MLRGCFDSHKRFHTSSETFIDNDPTILADANTVWVSKESFGARTTCDAYGLEEHEVLVCKS